MHKFVLPVPTALNTHERTMKQLVVLGAVSFPSVLAMVTAASYWLGDGDLGSMYFSWAIAMAAFKIVVAGATALVRW